MWSDGDLDKHDLVLPLLMWVYPPLSSSHLSSICNFSKLSTHTNSPEELATRTFGCIVGARGSI